MMRGATWSLHNRQRLKSENKWIVERIRAREPIETGEPNTKSH